VDKPTLAILLTLVVHLLGIAALLGLAFAGQAGDWRTWWPGDDDGRDPGGDAPEPTRPPGGGVPLPDAEPASVRLRSEHERLVDARRRARRPDHAPEPARTREPAAS
jgi:hypothetical protein